MSRKSIDLGGVLFFTKKEARAYVQKVLHGTGPGNRVTGEGARVLAALLTYHPDYKEKVAGGDGNVFHVRKMHKHGETICFEVERPDESRIDFSFETCLRGI